MKSLSICQIQEKISDFYTGARGAAEPIAYLCVFKLQTLKATDSFVEKANEYALKQEAYSFNI